MADSTTPYLLIDDEYLLDAEIDGIIVYRPSTENGTGRYHYISNDDLPAIFAATGMQGIMDYRETALPLSMQDFPPDTEFRAFAGIDSRVPYHRRLAIVARLNANPNPTYQEMCSMYCPLVLHDFRFAPCLQRRIPLSHYLGDQERMQQGSHLPADRTFPAEDYQYLDQAMMDHLVQLFQQEESEEDSDSDE